MAVSTDELNTTLADLRPGVQMTFARANQLTDRLVTKKRVRTDGEGGTYIEKVLMTGSPAKGIGVSGGYETAPGVRHQKTAQLKVSYHEIFIPISISGKEMRENGGRKGIVKLIETYPMATVEAFQQDLNKYLLTGTTDSLSTASPNDFYGFVTLNGQFASGTGTGTTNGLLDFADTSVQSDAVESVVKSATTGHVNPYRLISAWAANGRKQLQGAYTEAELNAKAGTDGMKGPDLIMCDSASYANYIESKSDTVRIDLVDSRTEGQMSSANTFYRAAICTDSALDTTLFSSPADAGVWYGLNTDYWIVAILHDVDVTPFVDLISTQDVVTSKLVFHAALMCERLNTQFAIAGGAS